MFRPKAEASPDAHKRATQFVADHILIRERNNYDDYEKKTIEAWKKQVEALGPEYAPRGFWMRSDDRTYSEYGAHINYLVPSGESFGIVGAIDVSNDGPVPEIEVHLPKEDGSGEPAIASREAYSLTALDRAIALVEQQVL